MAKPKATLNPLRMLIDWAKRLVLETAARELAETATDATGFSVEPANLDHGDVPAIEYSSE